MSIANKTNKDNEPQKNIAETPPLPGFTKPQGLTLTPVGVAGRVHRATLFNGIKAGIFPPAKVNAFRSGKPIAFRFKLRFDL